MRLDFIYKFGFLNKKVREKKFKIRYKNIKVLKYYKSAFI